MKGSQKVSEDIKNEFIGIVNYSIITYSVRKGIAEQPDMENMKYKNCMKNIH